MTRKPQTTSEAIAYLYDALDIASRPNSWLAHSLQVIEVEHERTQARLAELESNAATTRTPARQ